MPNNTQERSFYPDFLRVIAIFEVILLHLIASKFGTLNPESYEWQVLNFYDGLSRWPVPIFIMVSGMFLLDFRRYSENVTENFHRIAKKNILRMVIALVFWSTFYLYFEMFLSGQFDPSPIKLGSFLFRNVKYHLWFLYLIIGLYIMTPFLQLLVKNLSKKDFELLLIILAISSCGYDLINVCLDFFVNRTLFIRSEVPELGGYVIYFLAGYYFAHFEISKKTRIIFYILAIVSFLFSICSNSAFAIISGKAKEFIFQCKLLNVMFPAFGIFIFVKNSFTNLKDNSKFKNIITKLSGLSFGIYLIHVAVLDVIVKKLQITTLCFNPIISVPLLNIAIFLISTILAWIISKIPILRKVI